MASTTARTHLPGSLVRPQSVAFSEMVGSRLRVPPYVRYGVVSVGRDVVDNCQACVGRRDAFPRKLPPELVVEPIDPFEFEILDLKGKLLVVIH